MNIQLLQVLGSLSKETLRAFEKFIQSPYHVTHVGVVRLYMILKGMEFNPGIERAWVGGQLFPNDPDGNRRLYHLTNYLREALEAFLAVEYQAKRPHERNLATIEAYRQLNLDEQAQSMVKYARRALEADSLRGGDYLRYDYHLQMEAYQLSLQQGRAKSFNVQEILYGQDVAFICEKLRTGSLLLSHQAVSKATYDNGLLNSVLEFLAGHPYLDIPVVAAYYHGYYAQSGMEGAVHFQHLKALLEDYAVQFSQPEVHDLFLMAINFCIRKINQGEESYIREIFELYRSGLQHGGLLENGKLSRWTYNNIAVTALRLREFDWVEPFLHEYARYLPELHREGAYHFNIARFYYETRRFQDAMHHLLKMEYDDVLQNLIGKVLLAKIYFELSETNALENQLDAIQIYLRRKKVLGYHKANYAAMIRFMRKMLALKPNDVRERTALIAEIEQAAALTEREWFLKQLA